MESVPAKATHAPEGACLAYEHLVNITLPGRDIPARVTAVQTSGSAQKVGDCGVLNVQQQGGEFSSGSVMVRIAPDGDISSRNLKAEDLAESARDNALQCSRLEKEHARVLQF